MSNIIIPKAGAPVGREIEAFGQGHTAFEAEHDLLQDIQDVPWPDLEHYGSDHGRQCAHQALCVLDRMGTSGARSKLLQQATYAAAMLHDVGRSEEWTKPDPHHGRRGAELAEEILAGSVYWAQAELRELICKAIALHSDPGEWNHPVIIALRDADAHEAARFAPRKREGMLALQKARTRLVTPWARDIKTIAGWMKHRGWS